MKNNENIIAIFAKAPIPGKTKTRIAAVMGEEFAANLSRAMLLDVINEMRKVKDATIIVFHPPDTNAELLKFTEINDFRTQIGNDLGRRMSNAFSRLFDEGAAKVAIIGSDCISIDKADIDAAFLALECEKAVLKPATDGGYLLIALKDSHPELFQNISWGTKTVMMETIQALESAEIAYELLPEGFDIDIVEDFPTLKNFLKLNRRANSQQVLRESNLYL